MINPLNNATEGYLSKANKSLNISTNGYLYKVSNIDIITIKEVINKKHGGNVKLPTKYKPVIYNNVYKETYQDEMVREDSEILTLIKIFLKCKN
jgi:hypothetical protein